MPFLPPNQQRQSTEGILDQIYNRKMVCRIGIDVDVVSLCYVPDDGMLGCRETLHVELKDVQGWADG